MANGLRAERPVFDSRQGLGILFVTASRPGLGPTHPPIQWIPGALLWETEWPGRDTNHSPPSSDKFKKR
jgi:hypothetical protein